MDILLRKKCPHEYVEEKENASGMTILAHVHMFTKHKIMLSWPN